MARENVLFYLFYNVHPVSLSWLSSTGTIETHPEDMDGVSPYNGLVYDKDYSDHLVLSDSNSYRSLGKVVW